MGDGKYMMDPAMNLTTQYGQHGLVLVLGSGLSFIFASFASPVYVPSTNKTAASGQGGPPLFALGATLPVFNTSITHQTVLQHTR